MVEYLSMFLFSQFIAVGLVIFWIIRDYLVVAFFWKGIYEVPLDVSIDDLYEKCKKENPTRWWELICVPLAIFGIPLICILAIIIWLLTGDIIFFISIIPSVIVFLYVLLSDKTNKAILKHRMKKRIHNEKQKEEKEKKIQQINVLERKLNSLNIKGFETEVSKIKLKLKSLNNIEEIEKDINALEIKINIRDKLERKLNYIEGFETEVSKIKLKLKSSNNIEEIEKDINALEIKINIRDNILNIINEVISQSKR